MGSKIRCESELEIGTKFIFDLKFAELEYKNSPKQEFREKKNLIVDTGLLSDSQSQINSDYSPYQLGEDSRNNETDIKTIGGFTTSFKFQNHGKEQAIDKFHLKDLVNSDDGIRRGTQN